MHRMQMVASVHVKSVDGKGDRRIIRGWATTPQTDRMGDVVEPRGAQYRLPFPLLWNHDHSKPVGKVTGAEVTDDGIRIVAEVARGLEEADRVWALVSAGLVESMSIGFRSHKSERLGSGGLRFTSYEILELSLVTIPANANAVIQNVSGKTASAGGRAVQLISTATSSVAPPRTKRRLSLIHI